jgi:hypothetical protein
VSRKGGEGGGEAGEPYVKMKHLVEIPLSKKNKNTIAL